MRRLVVASAAAINAGTGANWSPKWSGMKRVEYPRSSAFFACAVQLEASLSGATDSCAANRNGCDRGIWVLRVSGPHDLAAVDVEDVTGHPSGFVGKQEHAHA